jgi:hypothetical protein
MGNKIAILATTGQQKYAKKHSWATKKNREGPLKTNNNNHLEIKRKIITFRYRIY